MPNSVAKVACDTRKESEADHRTALVKLTEAVNVYRAACAVDCASAVSLDDWLGNLQEEYVTAYETWRSNEPRDRV